MQDYQTPGGKVLSRDLTSQLNTAIQFLVHCRPLSVPQGNAIKFLKLQARTCVPDKLQDRAPHPWAVGGTRCCVRCCGLQAATAGAPTSAAGQGTAVLKLRGGLVTAHAPVSIRVCSLLMQPPDGHKTLLSVLSAASAAGSCRVVTQVMRPPECSFFQWAGAKPAGEVHATITHTAAPLQAVLAQPSKVNPNLSLKLKLSSAQIVAMQGAKPAGELHAAITHTAAPLQAVLAQPSKVNPNLSLKLKLSSAQVVAMQERA